MDEEKSITEAEYHRIRRQRVGIEYIKPPKQPRQNAVQHHDKNKTHKKGKTKWVFPDQI